MQTNTSNLDTDELMHLALHASDNDQPEKAIDYLKQLLTISNDDGKAYYLLGAMHAEIGMYDRAVDEMTRAVELEPHLPTAHFQLGLLHLTSGRIEEATNVWQALDVLGEDDPLFLFKRGMLNLVRDDFDACIEDLSKGIQLNQMNEALNDDMRNIIVEAKNALEQKNNNNNAIMNDNNPGRHVLLSAYQRGDDSDQ